MTVGVLLLESVKAVLRGVSASTDAMPAVKGAAGGALWLIEHIQDVCSLPRDRENLSNVIVELAEIISQVGQDCPRYAIRLMDKIEDILEQLRERVHRQSANGKISWLQDFLIRFIMVYKDRAKLLELENRLKNALESFKLEAHLGHDQTLRNYARYMEKLIGGSQIRICTLEILGQKIGDLALHDKLPAKPEDFASRIHKFLKENPDRQALGFDTVMDKIQDRGSPQPHTPSTHATPVTDIPLTAATEPTTPAAATVVNPIIDPEFSASAREIRRIINEISSRLQDDVTRRATESTIHRDHLEGILSRRQESIDELRSYLKNLCEDFKHVHYAHHKWEKRRLEELSQLPQNIVRHLIQAIGMQGGGRGIGMDELQAHIEELAGMEDALTEAERRSSISGSPGGSATENLGLDG